MEKKSLIFLESNYSYLISLLHNNFESINICFFSKLKKTKNFLLFSYLLTKYRKSNKIIFKKYLSYFLKIILYIYLSLFFFLNKNKILNIYTSMHTFTGSFLINFLIRKKIINNYVLVFPDDGFACEKDYFWEVDYSKKYLKFFKKFLLIRKAHIIKNDKRVEIFDLINEIKKIDEHKKSVLKKIFKLNKIDKTIDSLLITQPIEIDGLVKNQKEKTNVYSHLLKEFNIKNDKILYVKQHPRERKKIKLDNYKLSFLPKAAPMELLLLFCDLKIKNLITIYSTSYRILKDLNYNVNIYKKNDKWLKKFSKNINK